MPIEQETRKDHLVLIDSATSTQTRNSKGEGRKTELVPKIVKLDKLFILMLQLKP